MSVKSLRAEHAQATKAALMKAARELFAERGFADVAAEEIVQRARVTRGALYHHFKDKKDLFGAVCDEVGAELGKHIEEAAMPIAEKDPWGAFTAGVDAFLDACTEGDFHRLALVEAPAIEGWEKWREHAEMHMLGLVKLGLQMAMDAGVMRKQPVDTLAAMCFAVLNEGAMLIGRAKNRKQTRLEVGQTIRGIFEGLRP